MHEENRKGHLTRLLVLISTGRVCQHALLVMFETDVFV